MKTLALAALAAIIAAPVLAETPPPDKGFFGSFHMPMIVCDEQAQIASITDAAKAKLDGARAKYEELKALMNKKGEPACLIVSVNNVAVGEAIDLGKFQILAGKWQHGWAVHIGTSAGEWWALYLSPTTGPVNMDAPALLPHHLLLI